MFKNLLDLRWQRSLKQATGFYIACLLLFFLVSAVCGEIYGVLFLPRADNFNYAFAAVAEDATLRISVLSFNVIMSSLLMAALVWKKGLYKNVFYMLLVPAVAGLAYCFGELFALIPPAYVTTYPPKARGEMHV